MKNLLAILGLVVALAGLGVAIFQDDIRDQQPTSVESVTQDALDKGRELWDGEQRMRNDNVTWLHMGLGGLGALLGLAGLLKKENPLVSLGALLAGGAAAGWGWIVNLFV